MVSQMTRNEAKLVMQTWLDCDKPLNEKTKTGSEELYCPPDGCRPGYCWSIYEMEQAVKMAIEVMTKLDEFEQLQDDGMLLCMPLKPVDTVYTIQRMYNDCENCKHTWSPNDGAVARDPRLLNCTFECPLFIKRHLDFGFEIEAIKGEWNLSELGEFGYGELDSIWGFGIKAGCVDYDSYYYTTLAEAEEALDKISRLEDSGTNNAGFYYIRS